MEAIYIFIGFILGLAAYHLAGFIAVKLAGKKENAVLFGDPGDKDRGL